MLILSDGQKLAAYCAAIMATFAFSLGVFVWSLDIVAFDAGPVVTPRLHAPRLT